MRSLQNLIITSIIILLGSCGIQEDRFRIEGRFKNISQGEFYLYNFRNGTKDTLKVMDGSFVYDVELTDTTAFVLMFPNFSELPVFAQPGCLVKIDGDVSHLKETVIKGTEENELMTAFRLGTKEMMPPEVRESAEQYIVDHSEALSSVYLLRRYFIQNVTPDYQKAFELCELLHKSQPTNVELVQLLKQLTWLKNMRTEGKLPHFTALDTKGREVNDGQLNRKVNVILAWATWNFDSQSAIRQMKSVYNEHPRDVSVVTVCLDASEAEGKRIFERDSLKWPNICDGLMWDSPVVTNLGLAFVPDNIVTGADGKIIARSLKNSDLLTKVKELLE